VTKRTNTAYYVGIILKEFFMRGKDNYSEPKTFTYPGIVAKVYSPILTDEERKRRMARIAKSAERLLKSERKENV
jgi:hypothetical protein